MNAFCIHNFHISVFRIAHIFAFIFCSVVVVVVVVLRFSVFEARRDQCFVVGWLAAVQVKIKAFNLDY